ncbi:unnamed protein product [Enterobius vermicularis]|uniref:Uncharacterized protein n=1 Tax=Enterobius vermicularis TaxID=51028 RepID=A0A0N4UTY9_ENTVE|nr:unnamed protein product [Enterobius vermicularis]
MAFVDGDYDDDDEVDGATVTTLTTTTMMLEGRKVDNKEVTANKESPMQMMQGDADNNDAVGTVCQTVNHNDPLKANDK